MKRSPLLMTLGTLLAASCGVNQYGGGISDHGNERVAGVITDRNGNPAAGVTVYLLPDDYNHITDSTRIVPRETFTNDGGGYAFDSLDEGRYTIRAQNNAAGTGCLIRNVEVDSRESVVDTLMLNNGGSIYFETDSLSLSIGLMIYLPGLPYFNRIDSTKIVTLFSIPTGRIALKVYDPSSGKTIDLGNEYLCIEIVPGASLLLPSRSPKPYCLRDDSVVTCVAGYTGETFIFSPIHPSKKIDGNYIYRFSWGEGTISDWGYAARWEWKWDKPGFYSVQSQVMRQGVYLAWSDPILIEIVDRE